jgi:hypothetical protein
VIPKGVGEDTDSRLYALRYEQDGTPLEEGVQGGTYFGWMAVPEGDRIALMDPALGPIAPREPILPTPLFFMNLSGAGSTKDLVPCSSDLVCSAT